MIFQIGDFAVEKHFDDSVKQESMSFVQVDPTDEKNTSNKRLFDENQSDFYDSFHENQKRNNGSKIKSGPLLSGICYCISSCSMILLNKIVLSSYDFNAGISLMLYQNLISVAIVVALGLFGVVSTEKLTWKLIRLWVPVNIIFVGMLVTGMFSLKYINVAMVTILKNLTNILTAIGEMYLFRKRQNIRVWVALFFMVVSSVSGGIIDLSFDAVGYTWQIVNCILTASYSLILRQVMDTAKQAAQSGKTFVLFSIVSFWLLLVCRVFGVRARLLVSGFVDGCFVCCGLCVVLCSDRRLCWRCGCMELFDDDA